MTKFEFQSDVMPRLADLAEAYDRKPPSDAALRIWRETLEPLPLRPVTIALQAWARGKTKPPAPAEIYTAANDLAIDDREHRVESEKSLHASQFRQMGSTPRGREALRLIRDLVAAKVTKPDDSRAWSRRILDRYADGEPVVDIALRGACEVLKVDVEAVRASVRKSRPVQQREKGAIPL